MGFLPGKLVVLIGGYMGPSYRAELSGTEISYSVFDPYGNPVRMGKPERFSVDEEGWRVFRSALDEIGIWNWHREYPNPGVRDGTQWHVDIAYGDRIIECCGDNCFPGEGGAPSLRVSAAPAFQRFLVALSALVGGRNFQ